MTPVFDGVRQRGGRTGVLRGAHRVKAKPLERSEDPVEQLPGVPAASIDAPSARLSLGKVASPQSLPLFHRAFSTVKLFRNLINGHAGVRGCPLR